MNLSLTNTDIFVCIDMQRLFLEPGDWYCSNGLTILSNTIKLAKASGDRCWFTRFITPTTSAEATGQWRPYFEHWHSVTQSEVGADIMDLHTQLQPYASESRVFDKPTYDTFKSDSFAQLLQASSARTLVMFGIETDVCVLSSALSAVDLGFRVIVVNDATASSDMNSHQACLDLVYPRFDQQIVLATTAQVLHAWEKR